MFFLVALVISLEEDAPRIGNATFENAVELIDVQKVLAANTTFNNCSFMKRAININYYSRYEKDINSKEYASNITFINCDLSNATLYGSTDKDKGKDFFLDFNITIINSTIGEISSENTLILRFRRLRFVNCVINISTTSMYSTPVLEFANCTFVGRPARQKETGERYFIRLYGFDDCVHKPNDDLKVSFDVRFTDCVFNLDSKWNYMNLTTKTLKSHFLYISNAGGVQRTIIFGRCVTGNNMLTREDPLHFIYLVTTKTENTTELTLKNENMIITHTTDKQNGIGIGMSICRCKKTGTDEECAGSEVDASDWKGVVSNTGYSRPLWTPPPEVDQDGSGKEDGKNIWKITSIAAVGVALLLLIVTIASCVKLHKKKKRHSCSP